MTTSPATAAGLVEAINLTGGGFASFSPYAIVWTAIGGDGNYHIYQANLSNAAVAPTPVQVSSLSFPTTSGNPLDSSCFYQGYGNVLNPSTAFLIVEVPTSSACGSGVAISNTFVLIHLTDSPSTAPVTLPSSITTLKIAEEFSAPSGAMTGLVLVDTNGNLNFYPVSGFPAFTGAQTIKSNVTFEGHLLIASDRTGHAFTPGSLVFSQVVDAGGNHLIFRIDSTGSPAQVYSTTGTINGSQLGNGTDVNDNANFYFTDSAGTAPSYTSVKFVKMSFGGTPTTLYTDSAPGLKSYSLVDADASVLIIHVTDQTPPTPTIKLLTLTTGSAGTPSTLASVNSSAAFGLDSFLDFASDHLFVNTQSSTTPTASAVYTPASGTVVAGQGGAGTAYSQFNYGNRYFAGAGVVFQLTNVTTPYPLFSNASMFTVNASSFASTQVKLTAGLGGGNYTVPAGAAQIILPFSSTIGGGLAVGSGTNSIGLLTDVSKSQILTISPANTSVTPF